MDHDRTHHAAEGAAPRTTHTVSVFLVERLCVGPEEGGCYVDHGTLAAEAELSALGRVLPGTTFDEADAVRADVQAALDRDHNVGPHRYEIESVLSAGRYRAEVHEGWPPHSYPQERQVYS